MRLLAPAEEQAHDERSVCGGEMDVVKDVFLTDGRAPYLTLTLASRDTAAHGLLTGLSTEQRDRLHALLAESASALARLLRPAWQQHAAPPATTSFGCGT